MRLPIILLLTILIISCSKESSDSASTSNNTNTASSSQNESTSSSSDNTPSSTGGSGDNSSEPNSSEVKVVFNSNIHNSLPSEWIEQYNFILDTLEKRIPSYANNYTSLDVYAWNSNVNKPYSSKIGDASGACVCGNDQGRYIVLEIPEDEFTFNSMHRYSVIAHEFFHAYQMSISSNFNSGDFRIKWLNEGSAATFESLYIQEHYNYNYFTYDQNRVDKEATSDPSRYEKYNSGGDSNYSSSVFMTLALVKELMALGNDEADAIRMVVKDFQEKNPSAANWKSVFEEVFSISVDAFYSKLSSYEAEIKAVLPSESLTLQSIFKN
jgi:hypothetical protein